MKGRFVFCVRCSYVMDWLQHSQLRAPVSCVCGRPDTFGPEVYVPDFKGYAWDVVLSYRRTHPPMSSRGEKQ